MIDLNNDNKVSEKELEQAIKVLAKACSKGELLRPRTCRDTQSRENKGETSRRRGRGRRGGRGGKEDVNRNRKGGAFA